MEAWYAHFIYLVIDDSPTPHPHTPSLHPQGTRLRPKLSGGVLSVYAVIVLCKSNPKNTG